MKQILNQKIGDLAIESFSFIQLFQKYKVDFYCEGSLMLKEALNNAEIDVDMFLKESTELQFQKNHLYNVKIDQWPLDLLADYIQKTHHRFTDQILVDIKNGVNEYLSDKQKVDDTILTFKEQIELLAKELGGHMKKEELILFPYIRKMIATRGAMVKPRFESVGNPIDMMIHEHNKAFLLLKNIRLIFNNYEINDMDSIKMNEIKLLMSDLDHDLTLHLHLENNILFPKVIEFEKNKLILST